MHGYVMGGDATRPRPSSFPPSSLFFLPFANPPLTHNIDFEPGKIQAETPACALSKLLALSLSLSA